ncbi:MAG: c-type cytochrome [Sulfuriferula sp.]|nr:c-type cytochrome [Sulfuriferula sp.]
MMNTVTIGLVLALTTIAAGCTTTDSSRNLADAGVPGKALAQQVCSICHGADGNSTNPTFPKLAGQQESYLIGQLTDFRSHGRSDPAGSEYMWGISRHLTDVQIQQLAAYFAQQQPIADTSANAKLEADGKAIFMNGLANQNVPACETCHGAKGEGNASFPRIAGQHADYIAKQLRVFKDTEMRPKGAVMKVITHDLAPDEIQAVAAYVSTISR